MRVAVVGSGPSGVYAADALISREDVPVEVDIIDRLPVPFGLVRYGVAPDHMSIRSVRDTLNKVLQKPGVRFVGNVEIGTDVSLDDLRSAYDAVILTYGASSDRRLGIPGEDLAGSVPATGFVAWYTGHPDADRALFEELLPSTKSAVVIGVGNVAVDVTRVLAKNLGELDHTDMPQHVLEALQGSGVTDVYLLGRRGPAQATFTTKELKELGELEEADVLVRAEDVELDAVSAEAASQDRSVARNVEVVQGWAARESRNLPTRIHVRFFARPVELRGDGRVTSVAVERTRLTADGGVEGTGVMEEIPADLVIRSVGYRGTALPGVPFDESRGVIPHEEGRVMLEGAPVPGLYVAGWIKRGPTGIIGTNKKDAVSTVASVLSDATSGALPVPSISGGVESLLANAGDTVVGTAGWNAIDVAEQRLGASRGRDRTTIHDREELLRVARP